MLYNHYHEVWKVFNDFPEITQLSSAGMGI